MGNKAELRQLMERVRVEPGKKVDLERFPTTWEDPEKYSFDGLKLSKENTDELLAKSFGELDKMQEVLWADGRFALLIILQGMDAAGKDGIIEHVMAGVNPQACEVMSFKTPTAEEASHDFLWRCVKVLPEKGKIGIFNRSYYEECLVTRVHPDILAGGKIPPRLITKKIWRERFEDISAFERYLARNGTVILKFFLNVSKEEQRERFLERLDEPAKNWKFSMGDITERALWPRYQAVYQEIVRHTSTALAPWYVVPADHKWFARAVIGSVIVAALDKLDLKFPRADKASLQEFKQVRKALENEGKR
jgi:PPK2 family polyphosphate:nucleotide phosphotransferase